MFISDFAIKKPIVTIVTMVALVAFGGYALMNLETDEFPDIAQPIVTVSIPYPGASPDVVEREVIDRIEEAISGINGVDRMQSTSMDGFGSIMVMFVFEKGVEQAAQDVRDAVALVRGELPLEIEEPIIGRFDWGDEPIVSLTLSSPTLSQAQLTSLADPGITRELRSLPGVAEVQVIGGAERELTVQLRPGDLMAAGVSVDQVAAALRSQNLAVPVGSVEGAIDEKTIRLQGRLDTPEQFLQLVVAERNGQIIRLGQVADVRDGSEEARTMALFNGKPAIGIDVRRTKGYSTTTVADRVKEKVTEIQGKLPATAKLDIVRDAGERVENSVANVEEALIEGALLTVLVVFLFLNSWRSTVITGLALPVSVLAAFIAVNAFGFTLNTMSLLGLTLAIGILIDDAIVVRENIVRHIEMGEDHYTASQKGTDEIGLAVAATTFSIVAVFIPIAFMYGEAGQWFKPFALTIACAVLVSLFVSFSLDPMLSAYWADPQTEQHERKNPIARALDRFNTWFDKQADNYKRVIAWALDHRMAMSMLAIGSLFAALAIPAVGILGALVVLAAVIAAFKVWGLSGKWFRAIPHFVLVRPFGESRSTTARIARGFETVIAAILRIGAGLAAAMIVMMVVRYVPVVGKVGGGFVPVSDRSEITINIETPPGSNLDYTRLKAEEIARLVRAHKEIRYTYTTVGTRSSTGTGGSADAASIYVRMIPKSDRDISQDGFGAVLRKEVERVGGAKAYVFTSGFGGDFKQIQLEVRGPDANRITEIAQDLANNVKAVPGAVDVGLSTRGQKPELNVNINRGVAGSLGITTGQIAMALRPAFAGVDAGDWIDPSGETRDVVVRLAPEARRRAADIRNLPLVLPRGGPGGGPAVISLDQVATVTESVGPAQIDHLDREKVVIVGANVQGRSLGEVSGEIQQKIAGIRLQPGYRITQGGEVADQAELFGRIFAALGFAILLMYLVLVMQFGSFLDPLAIMMSLPLSLIGVVLALLVTNDTLNIMSMIGIILLMGIVAKNAILLIDFAKWGRERGMSRRDALIEAGRIRLRPIMMTTFALIAGMIPVALGLGEGADFRAPLGRAIIGGVITSTVLTLVVIPTVYEILDEWKEWALEKIRRRRSQAAHGKELVPEAGD
jgi:hydrophobic/amphiphilic exporter-1 (mainly G- bacteria), HAE1 family